MKLTQTSGPNLGGKKTKRRKNSTLKPGKGDLKHKKLKKEKLMKRQRNTTQMRQQIGNIEVKIDEEELGKLPEKEFRIMIVKMVKNLENKMKIQDQLTNT